MFSIRDNMFSHKNAIIKNTQEKTSYLPKVDCNIIPKIKTKRTDIFRIVEDKYTLVAGFKARFRIYIRRVFFEIGAKVN